MADPKSRQRRLPENKPLLELYTSDSPALAEAARTVDRRDELRELLAPSSSRDFAVARSGLEPQVEEWVSLFALAFNRITVDWPQLQHTIQVVGLVGEQILALARERSRNIQLRLPRLDPFWEDLFRAQAGDRGAAARIASYIRWRPSSVYCEAIKLKARSQGKAPEQVRRDALTQGLLLALDWDQDAAIPLLLQGQSTWVYAESSELTRLRPSDLEMQLFWEWVQEESCRAAELRLVGHAYAPTIVLEEPPGTDGELRLARFKDPGDGSVPAETPRGRPYGSSIFPNQEAFLVEVRMAIEVVSERGNRVTQERVAEVLAHKGLMGSGSPERQLRRWVREFGFEDWRELLAHIRCELLSP